MSSALRLSIIAVMVLASAALGLIAFNMMQPKQVAVATANAPADGPANAVGYVVAARPLPKGTLARMEDFTVRAVPAQDIPAGAILENSDTKAGLPGSLVRRFVEAGTTITLQDIVRPQDRGFLASVLAPDTRATSIRVDEESGVSGLIRPGDYVDVVLTQVFEKGELEGRAAAAGQTAVRRALSETILRNVRVIAIDQEIVQGGRGPLLGTGKPVQTVSLELAPEQVNKVTVARQIGKLSLTVRSAVDQADSENPGAMSSCDVSPELARQNAVAGQTTAVAVYTGGEVKQYSVRKDGGDTRGDCDGSRDTPRQAAAGRPPEKR
jgi:pilus assembly protein CpaB